MPKDNKPNTPFSQTLAKVKVSGKSSVYSSRNASGKSLCEIEYPNGVVVRVTSDMTLPRMLPSSTPLWTAASWHRSTYANG